MSEPDQVVEQGEMYDHTEYGPVEVTGIWKGVNLVDTAHNTDESEVLIVRYASKDDDPHVEELTDTLDEFFKAIE